MSVTDATRRDYDQLICRDIRWYFNERMVVKLKRRFSVWCRSRVGLFCVFLFFFLSQLVAKLNVLVREMTHQQPEVLRGDRANFSFTSLSIANVLVFTAANTAGLWCQLPVGVSVSIVPLLAPFYSWLTDSPFKSVLFWPYVIICSASMLGHVGVCFGYVCALQFATGYLGVLNRG